VGEAAAKFNSAWWNRPDATPRDKVMKTAYDDLNATNHDLDPSLQRVSIRLGVDAPAYKHLDDFGDIATRMSFFVLRVRTRANYEALWDLVRKAARKRVAFIKAANAAVGSRIRTTSGGAAQG
jgi:hypothetical protein